MARRSFRNDRHAAFPVFEAVLVAIMVFTAIMFMTNLQRPSASRDAGGLDLGVIAADTVTILEARNFTIGTEYDMEGWVTEVLEGNTAVADAVDDFLLEVLPAGSRYVLRLDNGVDPLHLFPEERTPLGGRAATTFFLPDWQANGATTGLDVYEPGREVVAGTSAEPFVDGTYNCIRAPTTGASDVGPAGTWASFWSGTHVPTSAPLGVWSGYANADCTGATSSIYVGFSPDYDRPVYGLELVVWGGL